MTATVHIVGVGPGDPELLTLRAVRRARGVRTIVHAGPRTMPGSPSRSSRRTCGPTRTVRGMALAMRRGPDDGTVGYDRVALGLIEDRGRGGRRPS